MKIRTRWLSAKEVILQRIKRLSRGSRRGKPGYKKKPAKRKASARKQRISLPRYGFLPDKMCCRLKAVSEPFTLDVATGGQRILKGFLWNTPFAGFNGRKPREWNEMIALYNKCYVIGAKVTITCIPDSAVADTQCIWGIYTPRFGEDIDDALPNAATYADVTEDHRLMKGGTRRVGYVSGGNKYITMSKKWSAKKWSKVNDYINPTTEDAVEEVKHSVVDADCASEYQLPFIFGWLIEPIQTVRLLISMLALSISVYSQIVRQFRPVLRL